jgi:hypothetical protein
MNGLSRENACFRVLLVVEPSARYARSALFILAVAGDCHERAT